MKVWTFFDDETGQNSGRQFIGSDHAIGANTPAGMVAVSGAHEFGQTQLDLVSGLVVPAIQPLQLEAPVDRIAILEQLRSLDLAAVRPLSEIVRASALGQSVSQIAMDKLAEIEAKKEALRAELQ